MASRINILLLGRSTARLDVLQDMMAGEPGIRVARKVLTSGVRSPLADLPSRPDVLLLDLGEGWRDELRSVRADEAAQPLPPLIVLGVAENADMMRAAMQAGARDFHGDDVSDEELVGSVKRIGLEAQLSGKRALGSLTVVMNGKGGAGSSFVSSSLATAPALSRSYRGSRVALVDLDVRFGDLPVYFDMKCDDSLIQALGTANELDPVALEGLMRTHASGVRILAGRHEGMQDRPTFANADVGTLLRLLTRVHDHVVVDLPRHFDAASVAALELADDVVVVTQQTVPHVRDTRFVVGLLRDVGLPDKSVKVLVNRHDKGSQVRMPDVRDVFDGFDVLTVPNDYKRATFCVDNGVPLLQKWPKSPIARSFVELAGKLWPDYARAAGGKAGTRWFGGARA